MNFAHDTHGSSETEAAEPVFIAMVILGALPAIWDFGFWVGLEFRRLKV